ncbi:MAG TPA: hypothetical protein VK674_00690 [Candidatus Limnocylindria bacterium]|nr:hypothetical protein [Candidatus Limnocylindria bacterium]
MSLDPQTPEVSDHLVVGHEVPTLAGLRTELADQATELGLTVTQPDQPPLAQQLPWSLLQTAGLIIGVIPNEPKMTERLETAVEKFRSQDKAVAEGEDLKLTGLTVGTHAVLATLASPGREGQRAVPLQREHQALRRLVKLHAQPGTLTRSVPLISYETGDTSSLQARIEVLNKANSGDSIPTYKLGDLVVTRTAFNDPHIKL